MKGRTDGVEVDKRLFEPLCEHPRALRCLATIQQAEYRHVLRPSSSESRWIRHHCQIERSQFERGTGREGGDAQLRARSAEASSFIYCLRSCVTRL
jgi:hypothetical protein